MTHLKNSERTRCEVWTRVMGYHRPVTMWNPGKQAEHAERKYYDVHTDDTDADSRSAVR